jgi:hypothetical protein
MAATPSPVPDLRKNWRRVSALLIVSTGFMAFLTGQRFIEGLVCAEGFRGEHFPGLDELRFVHHRERLERGVGAVALHTEFLAGVVAILGEDGLDVLVEGNFLRQGGGGRRGGAVASVSASLRITMLFCSQDAAKRMANAASGRSASWEIVSCVGGI